MAKAVSGCSDGTGATCRVNLDTRWLAGAFDDRNGDLTFALRGFNYRQSGAVTMTKLDGGKMRVTGDTRIDFSKNYNFDYGDKFYGVDLGVFAELDRSTTPATTRFTAARTPRSISNCPRLTESAPQSNHPWRGACESWTA
ncbi:hypothetical protein AB0940_19125 [Streptomyces sp. NPDC006656]|uniref:hypothetical protein n=1 Tax=Streptomyces sp. NPDC006656 TaxID=3156899 RepID=UPI003456957A